MSKGWNGEKRCIVKTLNFENCVPTNLKAKGKGLKKLRATFSREIIDPFSSFETEKKRKFSNSQIIEESPDEISPVLTQKCGRSKILKSSPVLAKKRLFMPESPVFLNKRKQLFSETVVQSDLETPSQIRCETNKTSPVFKLKRPPVKRRLDLFTAYDAVKASSSASVAELIDDDDDDEEEKNRGSQIETSSSQETQESNEMKIESCGESQESESGNESDISDCTSDSQSTLNIPPAVQLKTPVKVYKEEEKKDSDLDSGKKKTRFVKNSLSDRLNKLNKLQLSERRIWEHEREIMKIDRAIKKTFSVISLWQDENIFTIKCRNSDETDQNLIMIINGDVAPNAHKIKENSIISISPPWQNLHLPKLKLNVILSVVCLEVKGELANPASHEIVSEPIDVEKWENDDSLLINCLFSLPH